MKIRFAIPVLVFVVTGLLIGIWLHSNERSGSVARESGHRETPLELPLAPDWEGTPSALEPDPFTASGPEPDELIHPARKNEVLFIFKDEAAYRRFLGKSGSYGLRVLSAVPSLRAVRLEIGNREGLDRALADLGKSIVAEPNLLVGYPSVPASTATSSGLEVPFKNQFLSALGLENRDLSWGSGVTVAVLDSGVQPHVTLTGSVNQSADYFSGESEVNGHGTAVASLIAGTHPMAPGVAPGAEINSYRVLGSSGVGDMFTVAEGIIQAVNDGADIINLSLGAYGESEVVARALDYAEASGVAVVAAVGNDGVPILAFPASHESVIAVGAVDARDQHVWFSNQGEGIDLVAPGYGLYAAYPGEKLVSISGTSFSGPMVTGMIAGILSDNPGMTGVEAAELVMANTHDAGRAGDDPTYGAGIPSYQMIEQANSPGIPNAGISGVVLEPSERGTVLHTAVQNRGTQTLFNLAVEVQSGNDQTTHSISRLDPGESSGFDWERPPRAEGDVVEVVARVRSGSGDSFPEDDELRIQLSLPE
jgi:hypothetical protein